jgi:hypothetical protein
LAEWCNARLVVAGRTAEVTRFRRLAGVPVARLKVLPLSALAAAKASRVFRGDMLVGEAQGLFSEQATPLGKDRLEKKYIFQVRACDEEGHQHFRNLSKFFPGVRFMYVYGWDGWNDDSYGSYLISRGQMRTYRVPLRLVEKVMVKHRVDDNPNDEWPFDPEIDAQAELMDLAEARWKKWLLR